MAKEETCTMKRVVCWAALGGKDLGGSGGIERERSEAVDGLGGEDDGLGALYEVVCGGF